MLTHPMHSLERWVAFFNAQTIPILRLTQRQLATARENIDTVSGKDITRIILQDPLLAVRVLAYIQPSTHRARLRRDVTTITSAVMMLGIDAFFKRFDQIPSLEDQVKEAPPEALLGALQVVRRSQQAAQFAYDWAVWRLDFNVEEVALAALLHDLAEILIYVFAPSLALTIRSQQQHDHALRSADIQREVLGGFTAQEIKTALYGAWRLPELLLQLLDGRESGNPRVLNVRLAVDLARHLSQHGWQDTALPDDLKAIARLLNLSEEALGPRLGLTPPEQAQAVARLNPQIRRGRS